jgi:3,5-epimerase/4-reductase
VVSTKNIIQNGIADNMKILIIGKGYVGGRCLEAWDDAVMAEKKVYTKEDVLSLIAEHEPDVIFNAAGVRGKPNVDWCEDHQVETMVGNAILPMLIAEACQEKNIYLLHIGSGCIFYGDSPHEDKKWRESDFGNPDVVYSRAKWAADLTLSTLPNVGIGRIRMPIDWIPAPTNMIDKLATYPKVIDVENSVTIVDDMVDVFYKLMEKKAEGIFHVTNPGTLKHKELVALYEELVDPSHTNEWISNDDLVKQGLATKGRSNNFLHSENLAKIGIEMREVHEALRDTMEKYAKAKKEGQSTDEVLSC